MAEWNPSYNALRVCVLFMECTSKAHYCYEVSRSLKLPITTAHHALSVMSDHGWLAASTEQDSVRNGPPRVHYTLTESGLDSAVRCLRGLRVPISGYKANPSSA